MLCRRPPVLLFVQPVFVCFRVQVRAIAMDVGNAVDETGYVPVICGLSRTRDKVGCMAELVAEAAGVITTVTHAA